MHLAIDVSEFEHQPTGVGSFIGGLLVGWAPEVDRGRLRITLLARNLLHDQLPAPCQGTVNIQNVGHPTAHPIVWQQTSLALALRRLGADVFFGPAYSLPHLHRTPSVVAMHDLSFERFPESWSWREGWRRRLLARSAARRARAVVTISEFSASELRELYGLPEERIVITPLGVREAIASTGQLAEEDRRQLRQRLGIDPRARILLHVGTLFERRHLPELAAAAAGVALPTQLVVVGGDHTRDGIDFDRLSRDRGLQLPVVHLPWIEDDDLVALYGSADLLVSLSTYEGFGLPVLEALAAGLPALVLEGGAATELWASHAATVESLDAATVARAIETVLEDPDSGRRDRRRVLQQHTWQRCADVVLEALDGVVGR